MDAPRDDLTRSYTFELDRADSGDGLTLTGYASVFNSPTRIDSWEGRFDEIVAPGAFKRTIDRQTPKLMFDHGKHPMIGSVPLGSFKTLREDAKGLYVEARLHDNWMTQPVRDAIQSGAVDGMSFRFSVKNDTWENRDGDVPLRTLREVAVPELGPVVFPAYADTTVGVRAQEIASLLVDDDLRVELARALLIGTPLEPASRPSTEDTPAAPDDTPRPSSNHQSVRFALAAYVAGLRAA